MTPSSSASVFLNSALEASILNQSTAASKKEQNSSGGGGGEHAAGNNSSTTDNNATSSNSTAGADASVVTINKPVDQPIGHGHFFTKKTFHKPNYCHHCTEMLWGLIGQGYICEGSSSSSSLVLFLLILNLYFMPDIVCNFVCHEKCQKSVVSSCSSIAHSLIKVRLSPTSYIRC